MTSYGVFEEGMEDGESETEGFACSCWRATDEI